MLCGRMGQLQDELLDYLGDCIYERCTINPTRIKQTIAECAALGDTWLIPIEPTPENVDNADGQGDNTIDGKAERRKDILFSLGGSKSYFGAYTSLQMIKKPMHTIEYPVKLFLQEIVESGHGNGLLLNPEWIDFILSVKDIKDVLITAESISAEKFHTIQFYRIQPRAVIDTNKIIAEWDEGWEDNGEQEPWRLHCWPIMPDGHFLLIFEQKNKVHDEGKNVGTYCRYRVLEYEAKDSEPVLLQKYRFSIDNGIVGTVFLHDGKFFSVERTYGNNSFSVRQMLPFKEDKLNIYSNIRTVATDSRGNLAVAYVDNLSDEARLPMMVFSPEGKTIRGRHEEYAHACEDLIFDAQDHLWFHIYPSADLKEMDIDTGKVTVHKLEMQGFCAFALSSDASKLFLKFNETGGGCLFYVMHRDESGDFKNPIRFEFPPNENGTDEKEIDYKAIEGMGASKNLVLLRMSNKLYLYDLDDLEK